MAVMMRELLATKLDTLRYEPTAKRLRVSVGSHLVADTEDSLLVWEPKRLVPAYAVAEQNISAELISTGHHEPDPGTPPILDPRNPFTQHTTSGEVYDVVVGDKTLPSAAFRSDWTSGLSIGSKKTNPSSAIPTTRFTGSTFSAAAAMSASS
jgi:hypothetical protein